MKTSILANFKKWTKADIIWTAVSLFIISCVCVFTWDTSENRISVVVLIGTVLGMFIVILVDSETPIIGEFMNAQFYGGNNPAPYLDAFSFIANITALVLMYCLFIEQWYLWVLVDIILYDDTWDRSGDQKRHTFHKQIIADLEARRIPYISLKGDLETRMKRVDDVLSKFQPYSNFFGRMM